MGTKNELLQMLHKHAYREGTFTLASGRTSDFYIDCKKVILRADGLDLAAVQLWQQMHPLSKVAVAGEGVGGVPLAAVIATKGFLELIVVRKERKDHGTGNLVEYAPFRLSEGSRVVVVEDVLTTGGSVLRAVEAIRGAGMHVCAVVALVDRLEGARQAIEAEGIELRSVFTREDFVGVAT